jgi:hypothetical protein
MGSGDAFHDTSNYFSQIVNRYSASIAGLFFGMSTLRFLLNLNGLIQ